MSVTPQDLLDAMDGIAMILDHELRITRVGKPNWQRFLDDNTSDVPVPRNVAMTDVLGRPVTAFIAGEAVRATYAEMFASVLCGTRPPVQFDYRCDAPELRRDMRLSVGPIISGGAVRQLLYQSVLLSATPRPAIPLFGAPVADGEADDILTMCAICARVAWPKGAPAGAREWIEPASYYRRGGDEVAVISHGFCEDCFARIQDED